MKINSYLLATSMLLTGLAAAVPADAASTETQRFAVAQQQSAANQNQQSGVNQNAANPNTQSAMAPSSQQDAGVPDTETAVTVRDPGSHNDGYRTFQGWWKDD